MATGAQSQPWNGISRRRVPRFRAQAPLDVTVVRSGGPDTVPGRSLNVCERGVAAILAGELSPGETVQMDVRLSPESEPLRTTATVRYHDKLRCGFEFVAISPEQKLAIRDWTKELKPESDLGISPGAPPRSTIRAASATKEMPETRGLQGPGGPRKTFGPKFWLGLLVLVAIMAALWWWRWNRQWAELESGLKKAGTVEQPQLQVPTEVMQKLLVHKVEPVYPEEARKSNLEGIIALDIVVSAQGSVVSMRPLNGPDVLARAAMDALRWWKFSPYRVNGQPMTVETTMAVEFKK
jgi:TonB family protein